MFENDYTINGKHATYTKFLVNEAHVFARYIDVYMNAAVFGALYGRKGENDNASTDRARIYADAFANERDKCMFLFRLVMLLGEEEQLTTEQRINRAFRDDAQENNESTINKNLKSFNKYVLGGIEILHEKFTEGCSTQEEYIDRVYQLMVEFKEEMAGISYEEKLAQLLKT